MAVMSREPLVELGGAVYRVLGCRATADNSLCCSVPLGNDTLKTVLFAAAASMTACKSQLWWWYDERNAVYPENLSIQRLYYAVYDDDNNTAPANQACSFAVATFLRQLRLPISSRPHSRMPSGWAGKGPASGKHS